MRKLIDRKGKLIPFTRVPNVVIETKKLDVYAKMTYVALALHGNNVFPSYQRLLDLLGIKKQNVISRSLRALEEHNAIRRYKSGKKIYYELHGIDNPGLPKNAVLITFSDQTCNRKSRKSLTHGYPNKTNEQELITRVDENLPSVNEEQIRPQGQIIQTLASSLVRDLEEIDKLPNEPKFHFPGVSSLD
ncbi:hypothetical protein K2X30_10350 [bacterium]|jgi:hypothetical protein|nr:hypothetical protein [bacterium]